MKAFFRTFILLAKSLSGMNARGEEDPLKLGAEACVKEDYDAALVQFNRAIQLNPKRERAFEGRAYAYSRKKELDKAIADCNEAIRLNPTAAYSFHLRGYAYASKGEFEKAIANFDEAIRIKSDVALHYASRGDAYKNKRGFDKAVSDFNEAIRLDPRDASTFFMRAFTYHDMRQYDKAIADYDQAISLNLKDYAAYGNRGIAYSETGNFEQAVRDYNEAIRLKPDDANAYNSLAWLLATCIEDRFRDGKKALEYSKKACEMTGWKPWLYLNVYAGACAENGMFDEAVKWQKKAIELSTNTHREFARMPEHLKLYEAHKPYREPRETK